MTTASPAPERRLGAGPTHRLLPALLVLAQAGCPSDSVSVGGDETGGSIPAEPLDPFEGEGADPPGDPDPGLTYAPPSTLGNGMVHDSRYDLSAGQSKQEVTILELGAGVDWSGFVDSHIDKLRVGFRPTHVHADIELTPGSNDGFILHVSDRSVYVSDDDANYRTTTRTHVFSSLADEQALAAGGPSPLGSPRPTSIEAFTLSPGQFGFNVVWTYDNSPVDWRLVVGQPHGQFVVTLNDLSNQGYRPISVSSRERGGDGEYAAIFVQDGVADSDWLAMIGLDAMALAAQAPQAWDDGYYPLSGSYRHASDASPLFDVLWIQRSPGLSLQLRYNMDDVLFAEQDQQWRRAGYHLEDATAYVDAGVQRHAGMWVRHEPYLRWYEDIPIAPDDPTYVARYLPIHERVITKMTLEGEPRVGEYFRPSSTLHIFEGGELVLNRAYTYAPAIYPDTPINAKMSLASVSKSITAAAIVRQLNIDGLPLTIPFAPILGITNADFVAAGPTLFEVLRNLGGFANKPTSYVDHPLIGPAPNGSYPISGERMLDYMLNGHMNTGNAESYWEEMLHTTSSNAGSMVYSNPGYSMLGEHLRRESGISYESYVSMNLLAPLNLEQRIYPDPGHRNAHSGPTKSSLRSYLINTAHPYVIACEDDAECAYLACPKFDQSCSPVSCSPSGTCLGCDANQECRDGATCMQGECVSTVRMRSERAPLPVGGDDSSFWAPNVGPVDGSAPDTAAYLRYAGQQYVGAAALPAGGWYGDGEAAGILVRALAQTSFLMPQAVAAQLWNPKWKNTVHEQAPGWSYVLGWWVRGNWIAMAGGGPGAMATVLHNRAYDLTIVHLTNGDGNGLIDVMHPLLTPTGGWGTSILGAQLPCVDDNSTPINECGCTDDMATPWNECLNGPGIY